MSNRNDIRDGSLFDMLKSGIVYTELLGWVDMGHARGDDIVELKQQFLAGESSGEKSYRVMYRQDMRYKKFGHNVGIGKFNRWEIKSGRSRDDINSIMLAMLMNIAPRFEKQQYDLFSWYTDSGFSGEDLVSDLVGFYRTLIPGQYSYRVRPVSRDAAMRRWDFYGAIGSHKNKGFRPIIFPDPQDACVRHTPYIANLPHFMTWVRPWNDFTSGIVNILTDDGITLEFNKPKGGRKS